MMIALYDENFEVLTYTVTGAPAKVAGAYNPADRQKDSGQDDPEVAEEAAYSSGKQQAAKKTRKLAGTRTKQKSKGSDSVQAAAEHKPRQAVPREGNKVTAAVPSSVRGGHKKAEDKSGDVEALGEASAHNRSLQDLMTQAPQSPTLEQFGLSM